MPLLHKMENFKMCIFASGWDRSRPVLTYRDLSQHNQTHEPGKKKIHS